MTNVGWQLLAERSGSAIPRYSAENRVVPGSERARNGRALLDGGDQALRWYAVFRWRRRRVEPELFELDQAQRRHVLMGVST